MVMAFFWGRPGLGFQAGRSLLPVEDGPSELDVNTAADLRVGGL